jgi:hypothetical protein
MDFSGWVAPIQRAALGLAIAAGCVVASNGAVLASCDGPLPSFRRYRPESASVNPEYALAR